MDEHRYRDPGCCVFFGFYFYPEAVHAVAIVKARGGPGPVVREGGRATRLLPTPRPLAQAVRHCP